MGVLGALTAVTAVAGATSQIMTGVGEKKAADKNAEIFEAQATNIQSQKNIVAGQYRTKATQLRGEAVSRAARQGVKVSGSVAQSISQSITELKIEQSYQQYNLSVQKQEALDNAAYQRYQGRQALRSGFMNAGTTLLSGATNYYSKYWKNTSPATSQKGLLSGGIDTTNRGLLNDYRMA